MNDTALQARREYYRKWRAENRDKVQAAQERYWTKRAEQRSQAQTVAADPARQEVRPNGQIIEY